jgi:hypothetical protein
MFAVLAARAVLPATALVAAALVAAFGSLGG